MARTHVRLLRKLQRTQAVVLTPAGRLVPIAGWLVSVASYWDPTYSRSTALRVQGGSACPL